MSVFSSPIIRINDLPEILENPRLLLLDATIDKVNQKIDSTNMELIPDSIFFDIEGSFSDHHSNLPHTMVDAAIFTEEAQKLGIDQDSIIVIYDRWGVYSSPRAWWMFRYMGHENVYVLNGGLPAWKNKQLPTITQHTDAKQKGNFQARPNKNWLTVKESLLTQFSSEDTIITDARSRERFDGLAPEPREGLRSGHIPNAHSLPFNEVLDGIYIKENDELNQLYQTQHDLKKKNIFTCGSGITASILAIAAYQIGIQHISVYDGSWSEWGADASLPIAT